MSNVARVRTGVTVLIVTAVVAGISVPALAEAHGAPGPDPAQYTPPFELAHPVDGAPGFLDTFGAIRDAGDRLHHGIDIGAPTGTPVLAAAPGVVTRIDTGEKAGLFVEIRHTGGWRTRYLHLNDVAPPEPEVPPEVAPEGEQTGPANEAPAEEGPADESSQPDGDSAAEEPTPVDDGAETEPAADPGADEPDSTATEVVGWGIPEGIEVGVEVDAGDVVGYVGYSGNASSDWPHVHFELRMPDSTPVNPYPFLTGNADATTLYVVPDLTDEPSTRLMNVLGRVDPGGGFTSAVRVNDDVAYLGTYGSDGACPAWGVRRYAIADLSAAVELEPISDSYPGTWIPGLWVGEVATPSFSGKLAVVAHRACDPDAAVAFTGLALYDLTDPAAPAPLGVYDAGLGTGGVSDLDVWIDEERVLVGAVVPNSLLDHTDALGDVRIVDITDPTAPILTADWDFRRDGGVEITLDADQAREHHAEAIVFDTDDRRAFIAQWDAGIAVLDLTAPARPLMTAWHAPDEHREGNAASIAFDPGRNLLAVTYQNLDPLTDEQGVSTWGIGAVFDVDPQSGLSLLSTYSLDDAVADAEGRIPLDGVYTPLRGTLSGQRWLVAWASGGLRIVDLEDPQQPFEYGWFVPPTHVDPQRRLAAPNGNIAFPLAWSVQVVDDRVYIADLNTGLWVLELVEPPAALR